MSALVRSVASLYCQGLRRTVRLGGAIAVTAAARAPAAFDRARPFLSKVDRIEATGGGGGSPAARPPRRQGQEGTTPIFTWARMVVGYVLAVMAPFLQSKWATLLRIQSEVEMVKDAAETAVEVVEEVAAAAEKASAEVTEQLPEHGALRRAAALVERASREVAEEAHLAHDIIRKFRRFSLF